MVPAEFQDVPVHGWSRGATPIGRQPTVHHHTIVWRNAVVGLWEWADGRIVCGFFGQRPPDWKQAATEVETWIREDLGDVFVYAQDGQKQRAARVAVVRALPG